MVYLEGDRPLGVTDTDRPLGVTITPQPVKRNLFGEAMTGLSQGVVGTAAGTASFGSRWLLDPVLGTDIAGGIQRGYEQMMRTSLPASEVDFGGIKFNDPKWWARQGGQVVGQLALMAGAGVVGGPAAGATLGAAPAAEDSYQSLKAAGQSEASARLRSLAVGGATAILERVGLGEVISKAGGSSALVKIARASTAEGITEMSQEIAQAVIEKVHKGDPDATNDLFRRTIAAGALGGLAGGAMGGLAGVELTAPQKLAQKIREEQPDLAEEIVKDKKAPGKEKLKEAGFPEAETMNREQRAALREELKKQPAEPRREVKVDDLPDAEEAASTTWYHGTKVSGLSETDFSENFGKIEGLLGAGVYLTDDPKIAGGYKKLRRGVQGGTVYEIRVAPRNILNMEKVLPEDAAKVIAEHLGPVGYWEMRRDWAEEEHARWVKKAMEKAKTSTGMDLWKWITEQIEEESQNDQIPITEYVESFQEVSRRLRRLGYDAMTHIGGIRAGRGKRKHRVLVMLDPQNEFSAVGEELPQTIVSAQEQGDISWNFGANLPEPAGGMVSPEQEQVNLEQIEEEEIARMVQERRQVYEAQTQWRNDAVREIVAQFDQNRGGSFTKALRRAEDPDQIKRFDEVREFAEREYPALAPDEDTLFQNLKRGIIDPPSDLEIDDEIRHGMPPRNVGAMQLPAGQEPIARVATDTEQQTQRYDNLSNAADTLEARQEILAADESWGPRTRVQMQALQNEVRTRVDQDPDSVKAKYMAMRPGAHLNTEQQLELDYVRLKASEVSALGDEKAWDELHHLNGLWREAGAHVARQLAWRKDPWIHLMPPELRRKRVILSKITESGEYQDLLDALEKLGWTKDAILNAAKSKWKTFRLAVQIEALAKRPGWFQHQFDMVNEFWQQMILSGPQTILANTMGNYAMLGIVGVERIVEATINSALRRAGKRVKTREQLGDLPYYYKGLLAAITEGVAWRNAVATWQNEFSEYDQMMGYTDESGRTKMDTRRFAIGDVKLMGKRIPLGRFVRAFGWRHLMAADDFFKTTVAYMEAFAESHRYMESLGAERPTGDAAGKMIAQLLADKDSPAWVRVKGGTPEKLAFQGDPESAGTRWAMKVGSALRSAPVVGPYIAPFVRTPVNVFAAGFERTPLGFVSAYEHYRAYIRKVDAEARNLMAKDAKLSLAAARDAAKDVIEFPMEKIVRPLLGSLAMIPLLYLAGDDEDKSFAITGSVSGETPAARAASYRTSHPYSLKVTVGGEPYYVSYKRVEPFATTMATLVDTVQSWKKGEEWEMGRKLMRQAKDKTFLTTVGDISRMVDGEIDPRDIVSNIGAGFVPNLYRQEMRAYQNELTDLRIDKKDNMANAGRKTVYRMLATGGALRRDIWGREIHPSGLRGSWLATAYRMSGLPAVTDKDVVTPDIALARWNEMHDGTDKVYQPSPPDAIIPKSITGGSPRAMTDEEYSRFLQLSGQLALERASQITYSNPPTEAQINAIRNSFKRARELAKRRLFSASK